MKFDGEFVIDVYSLRAMYFLNRIVQEDIVLMVGILSIVVIYPRRRHGDQNSDMPWTLLVVRKLDKVGGKVAVGDSEK